MPTPFNLRPPHLGPACRVGLLLVLIGAAGGIFGQQSAAYRAGEQAFQDKNYELASIRFQEAERESDGKTDASLFLAKSLVRLQRFGDAEASLNRHLSAHPQDAEGLFLRGYLLFRQNHAAASLEAYSAAAKVATPRADDLKIVALDYVVLHDDASAVGWLERSLRMNANDAETWYFLGRAYFSQSRFVDAERAFTDALRIDPAQIRARNNLGLTYEAENRPLDALREYEDSVARDRLLRGRVGDGAAKIALETEAQPYLNLGTLLVLQNRAADAIVVLREATGIDAGCVPCHLQLGRALAREGQLAGAREELVTAVHLQPNDAALHYELGLLYQRSGEKAAAKVELARSKELYGSKAAGPGVP